MDKTVDLCYGSVKDAHRSIPLPLLGRGDHSCVLLLSTYRTVLKREKVTTKDIKIWTEDSVQCLQKCFESTNWNIFADACDGDLNKLADVTCSYAAFCKHITPCKSVKIYLNNRSWLTKSIKSSI